jgi:flavodoxin
MKSIVIYYSLDGNSHLVAEQLKAALGADILRLELVEELPRQGFAKMFHGGKLALTGGKPALKPYQLDLSPYDLLVLGGPVWAGSPAPALMSFIAQTPARDKKIALFCCHGGGKGKTFAKLRDALAGNTVVGELDIAQAARLDKQELSDRLSAWLKSISG